MKEAAETCSMVAVGL